ncbi:PQQ-like domain-containing protein [Nocardia amikacinitolerans]|uniref:outer membrane protein assembly factor BamB family protein n=1 Tax=Nocardia amikacinitolerans TaxID=756689 RepID=UPI0020A586D1|nr:PQQ-binding-like beta-propeller repeat protein [Nocardia amikacinitolerans]MCP2299672.1 PQQ-like domain-containing protein [Nocardia amikacinitolerans]
MRRSVVAGIALASMGVSACGGGASAPDNALSSTTTIAAPTSTGRPANPEPVWSKAALEIDNSPLSWISTAGDAVLVPTKEALVAVDRSTGRELWRREPKRPEQYSYRVSGDAVVFLEDQGKPGDPALVEVVEAADGRTLWQTSADDVVVFDKAIYTADCARGRADCTSMRHDLRSGEPTWPGPAQGSVDGDTVGTWRNRAPLEPELVAIAVEDPVSTAKRPWAVVEASTGTVLPGRAEHHAWHQLGAGDLLVVTDHHAPGDCRVAISATAARDGVERYDAEVYSGRKKDGECQNALGPVFGDQFIGAGTRIAAVTDSGAPQLFDLATGTTVWTGSGVGSPLDGDDRSLLFSEFADQGALSLLDIATGVTKWTLPDPGFSTAATQQRTIVAGDRVVIGGFSASETDRGYLTLVYDRESGRELQRYRGYLCGAGPDWVAVSAERDGKPVLEFHR